MSRFLPLLLVQAPARAPGRDQHLEEFEHEIATYLSDFGPGFTQARMVVYPELHLCSAEGTPEERTSKLEALAEPMSGPRVRQLGEIARRLNIWLLPGTVCERGEDGHLYNNAPVFSPEGELVASYRKCFPWRPFEPYRPGREFVVFDVPGIARVGLAVCYDIWFPEVSRQLAWMGAEVIINQAATTTCDRAQEQLLVRANAIFNQTFVVSANMAGPAGTGQSLIADPEGNVRTAMPGATPGILTDVLNLGEVERVRQFGTAGLNRLWAQSRPDDPVLELPMYEGRLTPGSF